MGQEGLGFGKRETHTEYVILCKEVTYALVPYKDDLCPSTV